MWLLNGEKADVWTPTLTAEYGGVYDRGRDRKWQHQGVCFMGGCGIQELLYGRMWHSGWCRKKSGISVAGCGSRGIPDRGAHEGSGNGSLNKGRPVCCSHGQWVPAMGPSDGVEFSQ